MDYGRLYTERYAVLQKAFQRGWDRDREAIERFQRENTPWISDYADFMVLKDRFDGRPWTQWPESLRNLTEKNRAFWEEKLAEGIVYHTFLQFCFYCQWTAGKVTAKARGTATITAKIGKKSYRCMIIIQPHNKNQK